MFGCGRASHWIWRAFFFPLLLATPAHADVSAPKPLFASDATIKIRIEAPFSALIGKASHSTDPLDAKISLLGGHAEELAIQLSARGLSRRNPTNCNFPPLRIEFPEKPGEQSLFKGQKSLKLVTHCRSGSSYQQYNLLEYTAYRLLNLLTPLSLRVRLAEIDYVEATSGAVRIHRLGFLIEDIEDLAKRRGLEEIKTEALQPAQLNGAAAARSALFEYMIGNLDWSLVAGPKGSNCCHNVKLIGTPSAALADVISVPYDFDSTGFVDPPYAMAPEGLPVRNVRTRYYRGFCQFNTQTAEAARLILEKRSDMLATIGETPSLSAGSMNSATRYLESFFGEIADPAVFDRRILKNCRN
jgi:hypothetical protein